MSNSNSPTRNANQAGNRHTDSLASDWVFCEYYNPTEQSVVPGKSIAQRLQAQQNQGRKG